MLPVTILQNYFEDHADLCALRRQILSQASKDRLASIGLSLIQAQQGSSSASKGTATHDLKELISIGMDVTLAGGVAAVGHLPLADIRALALEVRRKGGRASMAEETRRAVHMKLCKSGTAGANLLYSLGGAVKHFTGWDDLDEDEQAKLVKQILERALEARGKGQRASAAEGTRRAVHMKLCKSGTTGANLLYSLGGAAKHFTGWDDLDEDEQAKLVKQILARALEARGMTDEKRRASAASRTGRATSRFQAMFERLRALQGETTSLPQVVTTWFESTLSDLDKVTGPTARSKVGWVGKGPLVAGPRAVSSAQDKTTARDNEVHQRTPLTLTEEKESSGPKRRRGETAHGVVVRPATEGSAQAYGRPR
jgi:hypothetical protein